MDRCTQRSVEAAATTTTTYTGRCNSLPEKNRRRNGKKMT